MTTPLVQLEHVDRGFGGGLRLRSLARFKRERLPRREILRDVSFEVQPGEWLALMGENGSGKTTILKMIAGLLRPDRGDVRVNGLDVRTNGAATRRVVGYSLADERSFQWRLTARENLRFFATLEGLSGTDRARRVDNLLTAMDLSAQAERPFGEFSTGIRQRLAIARALLARPRILLMDEPTRSLDPQHADYVWRYVRHEMSENNGSVLIATHHAEEAAAHCQQLWVVRNGVLVDESSRLTAASGPTTQTYWLTVRGLSPIGVGMLSEIADIESVEEQGTNIGVPQIVIRAFGSQDLLERLLRHVSENGGVLVTIQTKEALKRDFVSDGTPAGVGEHTP